MFQQSFSLIFISILLNSCNSNSIKEVERPKNENITVTANAEGKKAESTTPPKNEDNITEEATKEISNEVAEFKIQFPSEGLAYIAGNSPMVIEPLALLDGKEKSSTANEKIIVSLEGSFTVNDKISIQQTSEIKIEGSNIKFANQVIGTLDINEDQSKLTISFGENSELSIANQVLKSIAFQNDSNTPESGDRKVSFKFISSTGEVRQEALQTIKVINNPNNLIGFWEFNDSPNSISTIDSSASQIPTSLTNLTEKSWVTNGLLNQSMKFNAANSESLALEIDMVQTDSFSISLWIKPEKEVVATPQHIFWQGVDGANGWGTGEPGPDVVPRHYEMNLSLNYFNDCIKGINFYFGANNPVTADCLDNPESASVNYAEPINSDKWTHVTVVGKNLDTPLYTMELYINGTLVDSDTGSQLDRLIWSNTSKISGTFLDQRYYNGLLDQVRIFQKVLSTEEILSLYLEGIY